MENKEADSRKVVQNMQRLLQELDLQSEITTEQAMEMLGVSESTVRRLFTKLADRGSVLRTFGGICRAAGGKEYSYSALSQVNRGAKQAIALTAAACVSNRDILYLDGGTTLAPLAEELARRVTAGTLAGLTVFTNSLSTLNALKGIQDVTLFGGRFRPNRQDFCGHIAENELRQLHFTKSFLGTDGIEKTRGFTTTDFETAQINSLVLRASTKSYVLADATKFGMTSLTPYAPPDGVVAVLTDSSLNDGIREEYLSAGFRIL